MKPIKHDGVAERELAELKRRFEELQKAWRVYAFHLAHCDIARRRAPYGCTCGFWKADGRNTDNKKAPVK